MPLLKRLIKINESKAVVIPHDYFEYYRSIGKEINKVKLELSNNILIEPILEDIKSNISIEKTIRKND